MGVPPIEATVEGAIAPASIISRLWLSTNFATFMLPINQTNFVDSVFSYGLNYSNTALGRGHRSAITY